MKKKEKKIEKLAGRAMKVAVLEDHFVALCNLGLPFSVSYQLQEKGLKLPDALWTMKSSTSGFSVSLFWPSSQCESLKKRKRQRKRNKAKKQSKSNVTNQVVGVLNERTIEEVAGRKSEKIPSRAHHSGAVASSEVEVRGTSISAATIPSTAPLPSLTSESDDNVSIDLTTCPDVSFEARDGHPGVRFIADSGKLRNGHLS